MTKPNTTLAGLAAGCRLLRPGGLLVVVAYPGHPVGVAEARAVCEWMHSAGEKCGERLGDPIEPLAGGPPIAIGLRMAPAIG